MRKQELYIFFIKIYFMSDIFANGILKKKNYIYNGICSNVCIRRNSLQDVNVTFIRYEFRKSYFC